ncbi:hypothetical protein ACO0K9_12070 [Undibacterium sp. Ji50W]|uniref:hypothetical protein n=1 Tax=Undibacterium sp. Ji50W TaxID=3413041 RepID=UPI003BF0DFFF
MAWHSYTVAIAGPSAEFDKDLSPHEKILSHNQIEKRRFVLTNSRRGAVFDLLKDICDHSPVGSDLYIVNEPAVLEGDDISRAADSIQALINAIEHDPGFVVEATKQAYRPTMQVQLDGFEPLELQVVHTGNPTIKDGWVYSYEKSEVLAYLQSAQSSEDPCPPYDDDGEGLEYAFGILKSHLALLRHAAESGFMFVFAELNSV